MSKYSALIKRATSATTALALSLASLTPAVMLGSRASAGQMTERKITVSNSDTGESGTYAVSFKTSSATTIKAVFVDFCDSPIIGSTCTKPTGLAVTAAGNQTIGDGAQTFTGALTNTDRGAKLTNATGETVSIGETIAFNLTVTNPTATGTYYARILTYDSESASYSDTSPGSYIDAGGVALSATEDVTINARVQETLTFCVGADDNASGVTACNGITSQIVDLGVLASGEESTSPVSSATDGNAKEGVFLLSTNAVNGAVVTYNSATSLRVGSETCENGNTNTTDQCINSDIAGFDFVTNAEKFGMRITAITDNDNPSGESTLAATAPYGTLFAWDTDGATQVASVGGVVSEDVATLTFKGQSAITTPSGYYTTSANFVATATF